MMQKTNDRNQNERGVALVATLMFLMAMGILSTALVFTLNNEMKASSSYKYGEQANYVANAGVQQSVAWFVNNYTPWVPASDYNTTYSPVRYGGSEVKLVGQGSASSVYPSSSTTSSFTTQFHNKSLQASTTNTGAYALNATLLKYSSANFINPTTFISYTSAIERWRIESVGYWGSNINNPLGTAQITAIVENSGNALFDRALWGIDSLDLGGTVLVDSYDPKLGPYGGSNIGNKGSVGSNGSVSINGTGVEVKGDVAYGPTGAYTYSGSPTVTGSIIHLPEPRYFPPIPTFTPGAGSVLAKNGTVTLNPGSFGTVTIGAHGVLALNPGTYYFDSISEVATGSLQINGDLNTTTTIFVKTSLDLSGQGVVNLNGDPTRLTINYAGTSEAKIAGGSSAFVELYAPSAPLKLVGTSNFYGSFIGQTVQVQGTPEVHFDEGCLEKNLLQRQFRMISWSKNSL